MSLDKKAPMGHDSSLQTVVETRHFESRVAKVLSPLERDGLIEFVAAQPLSGDILAGVKGVRKLRYGRGNKGKSGGVRVIYYYYSADNPIYLLEIFAKNEKENISKAERNALAKIADEMKSRFEQRTRNHGQKSF